MHLNYTNKLLTLLTNEKMSENPKPKLNLDIYFCWEQKKIK